MALLPAFVSYGRPIVRGDIVPILNLLRQMRRQPVIGDAMWAELDQAVLVARDVLVRTRFDPRGHLRCILTHLINAIEKRDLELIATPAPNLVGPAVLGTVDLECSAPPPTSEAQRAALRVEIDRYHDAQDVQLRPLIATLTAEMTVSNSPTRCNMCDNNTDTDLLKCAIPGVFQSVYENVLVRTLPGSIAMRATMQKHGLEHVYEAAVFVGRASCDQIRLVVGPALVRGRIHAAPLVWVSPTHVGLDDGDRHLVAPAANVLDILYAAIGLSGITLINT